MTTDFAKRARGILCLLLLLSWLAPASPTAAQDTRALTAAADLILAQFPAAGPAEALETYRKIVVKAMAANINAARNSA